MQQVKSACHLLSQQENSRVQLSDQAVTSSGRKIYYGNKGGSQETKHTEEDEDESASFVHSIQTWMKRSRTTSNTASRSS